MWEQESGQAVSGEKIDGRGGEGLETSQPQRQAANLHPNINRISWQAPNVFLLVLLFWKTTTTKERALLCMCARARTPKNEAL